MLLDNPQQYFNGLNLSPAAAQWLYKVYAVLKGIQTGNGPPLNVTTGPGLYIDISGNTEVLWFNPTSDEAGWLPVGEAQQGSTPIPFSTFDGSIAGAVDGINAIFTLDQAVSKVFVFRNGLKLTAGADYTFSGSTQITFISGNIPQPGDIVSVEGWS